MSICVVLKNCVNAESLLAYAQGQLGALEKADIEAHLEECEHCCVLLSQLVDAGDTLSGDIERATPGVMDLPQQLAAGHPAFAFYSRNAALSRLVAPPEAIGRYRIQETLGSGGFGVVYLAIDQKLGRKVAIKVPHSKLSIQPKQLELVAQEARTIAHLDHPNIVPIFDVGSSEEFPIYLVTKFIDGQNLAVRLRHQVTEAEAVEWSIQIAEALAYAHSNGFIHRDVKPQNILIDAQGQGWLTDFGLAWRMAEELTENPRAGTPAYMSPEQLSGNQSIGPQTDVYALGRILTELLLVSHTAVDSNAQEMNALDRLRAAQQNELADICQRACATDVSHRYATAKELAEALCEYAAKQGWHVHHKAKSSPRLLRETSQKITLRKTLIGWAMLTSVMLAGIMLTGIAIYTWVSSSRASLEQANIQAFLAAPSNATLSNLQDLSQRGIVRLWSVAESADSREQLAAKLVLMKTRPELAREVIPAIFISDWQLAPLLLSAYSNRESEIIQSATEVLKNKERSVECRIKVASFLAKHYPKAPLWNDPENGDAVSEAWIQAEPQLRSAHLPLLRQVKVPIATRMRAAVHRIFDKESADAIRILQAWQQLVEGDVDQEILCLVESPISLARPFVKKLNAHNDLRNKLRQLLSSATSEPDDPLILFEYRAHCLAAYCLLGLDEPDWFWELARHRDVPDLEFRFADFCDESADTLTLLANRLLEHNLLNPVLTVPRDTNKRVFSPELSMRRHILMALFKSTKWTYLPREPFDEIIGKLRTLVVEDADPGMQAVASRVLKGVTPVDQWSTSPWLPRESVLSSKSDRAWSLNSLNMVLVHIEQPTGCDHSFCLGQCEVDGQTFEQFVKDSGYAWAKPNSAPPTDGSNPALRPQNFVSWYDCAAFCNWLSRREGLEECYLPNAHGQYAEGMSIKPNAIDLNGYRLPTSQEWQIGCRAGAKTPYAMGYHFLSDYSWNAHNASELQPTGILPPNALGLFDMHGNVSEWILYHTKQDRFDGPINDQTISLCRGGDYESEPSRTACTYLEAQPVSGRKATIGFRVARTLASVPK